MEELPTIPKQSSTLTSGDKLNTSMEEASAESKSSGEECHVPSARNTSVKKGNSCTQSPESPFPPTPDSSEVPSPAYTDTLSADWAHSGSVRKSKTHDCVAGIGWHMVGAGGTSPDSGAQTPTVRRRGRLVSSVSFSGFAVSPSGRARLLRENRGASAGRSRDIIDYRNLTPQVPFVPSFAKSIPKKRISLRRPRRAIKDLLGKKRPKQEKATSPRTPTPSAASAEQAVALNGARKQSRYREHPCMGHLNLHEHNDPLSDSSSSDYCHNIYEDVTSLKSFGSQTGCGEIFAEEENHPSLEAMRGQDPDRDICEPRKASPAVGSFQGGVEQMASPAHSEVLDLFGMWDGLSRAILLRQSPSKEGRALNAPPSVSEPTNPAGEHVASPHASLPTPDRRPDVVMQKSDNQETVSTSDEGYYDYISPGQEDTSRDALTPCLSARFPRDSYSGDALYELFYDPNETGMAPIFDEEMGLSESVLGLSGDLPLSMYSFHVGAEENLAPPLAPSFDLVGQDLLQSSWKGKDCLLKLCDTEISLAMGIVNWLRQRPDRGSPPEPESSKEDARRDSSTEHLSGETPSPEVQVVPNRQELVSGCNGAEEMGPEKTMVHPADSSPSPTNIPPALRDERLVSASPDSDGHIKSRITTPTSGFCFRIYNKDSPLTPDRGLLPPALRSPGSTTSTVFLLAINKESLCGSCKSSLKQGSKELYLCKSCLSLIEHITASDLSHYTGCRRLGSPGTPRSLPRGFLDSPISPCTAGSDIDLLRVLEQCVGQVSSLKISSSEGRGDHEKGAAFSQIGGRGRDGLEKDARKEEGAGHKQRYLKSKHRRKSSGSADRSVSGRRGLDSGSFPRLTVGSPGSPTFMDAGSLGLVTANSSDELVLETYRSPLSHVVTPRSAGDTKRKAQTPRPRSLPLSNSAFSEFASNQCRVKTPQGEGAATAARGQQRERTRRHKKSAVNRDGPCGYVMPEEKKVERRRRMKK